MVAVWFTIVLFLVLSQAAISFSQVPILVQVDDSKLGELNMFAADNVSCGSCSIKIPPERFPELFSRGKLLLPPLDFKVFHAWLPSATDRVTRKYPIHLNEPDSRIAYSMHINPSVGNYAIQERQVRPRGFYAPIPWKGGTWFFSPDSHDKKPFERKLPRMHNYYTPGGIEKPVRRGER